MNELAKVQGLNRELAGIVEDAKIESIQTRHMREVCALNQRIGRLEGMLIGICHLPEVPKEIKDRIEALVGEAVVPVKSPVKNADIPDGDSIVLTLNLINAVRTNGSFTNATLNALAVPRCLVSGWVDRLVGKRITRERYLAAVAGVG